MFILLLHYTISIVRHGLDIIYDHARPPLMYTLSFQLSLLSNITKWLWRRNVQCGNKCWCRLFQMEANQLWHLFFHSRLAGVWKMVVCLLVFLTVVAKKIRRSQQNSSYKNSSELVHFLSDRPEEAITSICAQAFFLFGLVSPPVKTAFFQKDVCQVSRGRAPILMTKQNEKPQWKSAIGLV